MLAGRARELVVARGIARIALAVGFLLMSLVPGVFVVLHHTAVPMSGR